MYIVHVQVRVKPESIDAFRLATMENARHSLAEPGVARFDVLQDPDRPDRFLLVEVYRVPHDAARHKETSHYAKWRDAVAVMMGEPQESAKYHNVFPDEGGWDSAKGA
jgi:(4S)-4-hydroxy-5-phosphonooxypentane-2,3-dione isomerase